MNNSGYNANMAKMLGEKVPHKHDKPTWESTKETAKA